MIGVLLWVEETILMRPLEQPAARYVSSVRNSRHSIEPSSILIVSSVKRLGTVTSDSFIDLAETAGLVGSCTGGNWNSSPSLATYYSILNNSNNRI
jgi:hypothetical protein